MPASIWNPTQIVSMDDLLALSDDDFDELSVATEITVTKELTSPVLSIQLPPRAAQITLAGILNIPNKSANLFPLDDIKLKSLKHDSLCMV